MVMRMVDDLADWWGFPRVDLRWQYVLIDRQIGLFDKGELIGCIDGKG